MRLLILFSLFATGAAHAVLELPALFSDHAVLQREQTVPVWGWAQAGQEVTVQIAGQTGKAKADAAGKWRVDLPKLDAKGPQTLTVTAGQETKIAQDVLIGEVWLGSGQSNMAMSVNKAKDLEVERAAANLPEIRVFTERSGGAMKPSDRATGAWVICTPASVGSFSATAFFFGREVHRVLQVPVGLINSSVGGTPIETWIDREAQRAQPELEAYFVSQRNLKTAFDEEKAKATYEKQLAKWKVLVEKAKAEGKPLPRQPRDPIATRAKKGDVGGLFNGKIAPLIPYAIRGAIWYQGEANSPLDKAPFYQYQMPLLVKDWRARWGYEFPFAWVQLPNFATDRKEGWMRLREAQLRSLQSVPKSGMAVTLDIGEEKNIHPKNKQEVGRRLALWALSSVYGKGSYNMPVPVKHEIKDGAVAVTLSDEVLFKNGGTDTGCVVAGTDKVWHPAEVRVEGNNVIISSKDVTAPVAARYAWKEVPAVTLWTKEGLPVTQFRTDDW